MLGPRSESAEDLVARAVAATRELSIPSGPSAAIQSRTLAALHEAASRPRSAVLQRIYHMPWTSKATAVLATAASLLVAYVGLSDLGGSALAFSDVVEVLNKVRSATWKTTTEITGPQEGTVTLLDGQISTTRSIAVASDGGTAKRVPKDEGKGHRNETVTLTGVGMFLAPSHERMESTVQGVKSIQIVDGQQDKALILIPSTKTATVIELKNLPPGRESPFGKTFQGLRKLVVDAQSDKTSKAERLGVKTIDGRPTEGFRIQLGSLEVKIWADPKTSLPVRVEQTTTSGPKVRHVMSDFQVEVDLDESLFSLDVPDSYSFENTVELDVSKKPINILAEALKMAAEANDGVFPPTLRGEDGIDGILQRSAKAMAEKIAKEDGEDSAEKLKKLGIDLSMKLGGAFGVLFSLTTENDWHYTGKDVKLDTPDQPIFWYKLHKASTSYQVLYADLSVKEVTAEEVPQAPQLDGISEP